MRIFAYYKQFALRTDYIGSCKNLAPNYSLTTTWAGFVAPYSALLAVILMAMAKRFTLSPTAGGGSATIVSAPLLRAEIEYSLVYGEIA